MIHAYHVLLTVLFVLLTLVLLLANFWFGVMTGVILGMTLYLISPYKTRSYGAIKRSYLRRRRN